MKLQKIVSMDPSKNYAPIGEIEITGHAQITEKANVIFSTLKNLLRHG